MIRKNILIVLLTLLNFNSYSVIILPVPTCTPKLSPSSFSLSGVITTTLTVNVTTDFETCSWTATTTDSWISVNASGQGPGSFTFEVFLNKYGAKRTGTVKVTSGSMSSFIYITQDAWPTPPPPVPSIIAEECGYTDITRADPPSGIVYYWQTSSSGTSTHNNAKITRRLADGRVYLRAYSTITLQWSDNSSSLNVNVNENASSPMSVSASNNTICKGETTTLSYVGGYGSTFKWYANSCGGTEVGYGNNLSVSPATTTTYYGRWENDCGNSSCKTVLVTVNPLSTSPTTVSATTTAICEGTSTTLFYTGGSGTTFRWYANSCGGTAVGSGNDLSVSPTTTTTYYGRWESGCGNSSCKTVLVTVNPLPTSPTTVSATTTTICEGTSTTLFYTGGSGTTFKWYSKLNDTELGTGNNLLVSPTTNTFYYGRWESGCGNSSNNYVPVTVNPLPTSPTTVSATTTTICEGTSTTLSYIGGAGTDFKWYANSHGGTPIGSGNNLIVSPTTTTTYYGRWENSCGESTSKSVKVTVNPLPTPPTSVSASKTTICSGEKITLSYTGGTGTNFKWYLSSSGEICIGSGNNLEVALKSTTTYYGRWENSCGESSYKQVKVNVNQIPKSYSLSGGGMFCDGGPGVSIELSGSEIGVDYQLKWKGVNAGNPIAGDENKIVFFNDLKIAGKYTVEATNTSSLCSIMSDTITVTKNTLSTQPTGINTDNNNFCPGSSAKLTVIGGSLGTGATWEWYSGSCEGVHVGTGAVINVLPDVTTTYFVRAEGECNNTLCSSITIDVKKESNVNFVKTIVLQEPVQNNQDIDIYSAQNVQSIQYFDDLGRPLQSSLIGASPSGKDIVQFNKYDELGRQAKKYLPFTYAGNGELINDPVSQQQSFYNNLNIDGDKTHPYSEIKFDDTPFNRIVEASAPGATWSLGNGHTIKSEIGHNTDADQVIWWTVNDSGNCVAYTTNIYPPNSLFVTRTKNANWKADDGKLNTSETFTNTDGQTVLTRQFVKDTNDAVVNVNTYYVYDFWGQLRYVLTPEAINKLGTNYNNISQYLNKWCYVYNYDKKHRLISKKLPGIDEVVYVYDKLNRVIMTQNGNLRNENTWSYVKYDKLGRSIMTGLYTDPEGYLQSEMQDSIDGLTNPLFETHTVNDDIGYTNNAFPNSNTDILQVMYYDDYDFDNNGYDDFVFDDDQEYSNVVETKFIRGKLTGSRTKVLDGSDNNNWIWTVPFYDKKGRAIQLRKTYDWNNVDGTNSISGDENVNMEYDFSGKILKTKLEHVKDGDIITIRQRFEYDHSGRLKKTWHQINTDPEVLLSSLEYNELGQVIEKNLHSTDQGEHYLQSADYMYNIRGWLTKLNDTKNLGNDLFAMNFLYADGEDITELGGQTQYNGNISAIKWASKSKTEESGYGFTYDHLNRLTTANYAVKTNSVWSNTDQRYNMSVDSYDLNGNIIELKRFGMNDKSDENNPGFGLIDDLSYFYDGNQLIGVNDAFETNEEKTGYVDFKDNGSEFIEGVDTTIEYFYDKNGNMTGDLNKNIEVEYNHLNLPQKVTFNDDNSYIEYIYAADGTKLRKAEYDASNNLISKQDYIDGFIYSDTTVIIGTSEGRVYMNGSTYEYQYTFTDQTGNARLSFKDNNGVAKVIQENHYYPFGMEMAGLSFNSGENPYMYNSKELQAQMQWYDFGWRMQDPQLGVWHCLDPMAEQYYSQSPYHFAANNPINVVDPDGRSYSFEDFYRRHNAYREFEGSGGYGPHEAGPNGNQYLAWENSGARAIKMSLSDFLGYYNAGVTFTQSPDSYQNVSISIFNPFGGRGRRRQGYLDFSFEINLSLNLESMSAGLGGGIQQDPQNPLWNTTDPSVNDGMDFSKAQRIVEGPLGQIDWNGSAEDVLNGMIAWSKYLCQPNFGATKTSDGRYYHLRDVIKNFPRPSDGGYGTAGDIKSKDFIYNGNVFTIALLDVDRTSENLIVDKGVIVWSPDFFRLELKGRHGGNIIVFTWKNKDFYNPIGLEIFGDRWHDNYAGDQ